MNDFWFFIGIFSFTVAVCGVWVMGKVIFERWLNNDWCRHDWDCWQDIKVTGQEHVECQVRYCKKCNKAERRLL